MGQISVTEGVKNVPKMRYVIYEQPLTMVKMGGELSKADRRLYKFL